MIAHFYSNVNNNIKISKINGKSMKKYAKCTKVLLTFIKVRSIIIT